MNKFYSILIGENPEYTKTFQPASKRKIVLYATCLLVPVILWFINTYLLVRHVLEGSLLTAILAAFIAGLIIFLIERAILMSNGSKSIFWFRIVFGFIIASLGSISMDEVIFKHDIDNQVEIYRQAEIDNAASRAQKDFSTQIANQETNVIIKRNEWNQALADAIGEADGTSGSRQKQVGRIALLKLDVAAKMEAAYDVESKKLELMVNNLDIAKTNAKIQAGSVFNGNALLIRIRAMFDLIANDSIMLVVYILFTLFFFGLEFLVVLIKIGTKNSIDEDLEKARELLLRAKTKNAIERSELFIQPEHYVHSVQSANDLVKRNVSSIF